MNSCFPAMSQSTNILKQQMDCYLPNSLVCHALLKLCRVLPVISLTVLNTSSWAGCIFGVLVYVSLHITRTYKLSAIVKDAPYSIKVDLVDIERHEGS